MARVMIVDDACFMRTLIKNIIIKNGHEFIAEADNGKSAINIYFKYKPDVVFMDITMKGADGLYALKEILKKDPSANIIMCSAISEQTIIKDALKFGAKDYITKPFWDVNIIEALNYVCKQ